MKCIHCSQKIESISLPNVINDEPLEIGTKVKFPIVCVDCLEYFKEKWEQEQEELENEMLAEEYIRKKMGLKNS